MEGLRRKGPSPQTTTGMSASTKPYRWSSSASAGQDDKEVGRRVAHLNQRLAIAQVADRADLLQSGDLGVIQLGKRHVWAGGSVIGSHIAILSIQNAGRKYWRALPATRKTPRPR